MADSSDTPGVSNRRFLFWLIILGIGIPVLIELATFVRLIYDPFHEAPQAHQVERVQTGSELFEGAAPRVVLDQMNARAGSNGWTFEMVVRTASPDTREFELQLDSLEMRQGDLIADPRTHTWAPGDSSAYTAEWDVGSNDWPDYLRAHATVRDTEADSSWTVTRRLQLGKVPVRGR